MKYKIKNILGTLFFAIFYMFGLAISVSFAIYGWTILQNSQMSNRWPSVQGQIVSSHVRINSDEDGVSYFPEIRFKYVVDDHLYTSDTVNFGQYGNSNESRVQKIVNQYERGKEVLVYYDPDQPLTSVLEPGVIGSGFFVFGLGLCFSSIMGIVIPYAFLKRR